MKEDKLLSAIKKAFDCNDVSYDTDDGVLLIFRDILTGDNRDEVIAFVSDVASNIKIEFDFKLYGIGMNEINKNLVIKFIPSDVKTIFNNTPYGEPSK